MHHPDLDELLDLVAAVGPWTLLAVLTPEGHGSSAPAELAVRGLDPDPRSGAATMFGVRAPAGTTAVAVGLVGAARPLGPPDGTGSSDDQPGGLPVDGTTLHLDLVLDRSGTHRCRIRSLTPDGRDRVVREEPGSGLVVDALHCVLGLPAPGDPPPCPGIGIGLWSHRLLEAVTGGALPTWDAAAALHPAWAGRAGAPPSPETLAEAGRRFDRNARWDDLRERAAAGDLVAPELSAEDAAWLDATTFGRWCTQSVPPPWLTERELRANGCGAVDGYLEVVRRSR